VTGKGCGRGARQAGKSKFVNNWTSIIIWVAVIGAVFGYLWWQGQIRALANYMQETREELKKCSWPSWVELKGSTVVIMISIALMGLFTEVVDRILYFAFFGIK
jgi:preprotein translocase subunit SecE